MCGYIMVAVFNGETTMNKPDWKDAPEWANYLAMDASGDWYWYELEPFEDASVWVEYEGRMQAAQITSSNWKDSLEQRPQ